MIYSITNQLPNILRLNGSHGLLEIVSVNEPPASETIIEPPEKSQMLQPNSK